MNSNDLINEFFSKLYSGNINEFNKFIENNNLSANIKNNNNENALHIIVKSDLSDILKINFIKYLISKNIDINDKDCNGNTPFNLACQKQLFNIMIVLYNSFKNKINLYDKNNNDIQPIYYILKGIIVDELDDYPSPTKFIKNESTLKINDVSNLLNYVKEYVKEDKLFTKCENLIEVIKKNINFELQINKSLVDEKIDQFKNKIIQNKNDLSADFKYEFYNEIFNIIKKSHPKTFEHIDFVSTKSLDNDGFYLEINGYKTNYKIHGEPTFYQNLENVEQNNLIKIQQYENKYNEMIDSLNPKKFFFSFFEEIAHIYYCKEFSKNIERLKKIDQNDEKCNQEKQYTPNFGNELNDFIEYINSLGNGNSIKKIASGKNHNLILTNKGEVYAFGLNNDGQCGIAPPNNPAPNPNPVNEPTLIDGTGDIQDGNINYNNPNTPKPGKIKDIACGENHSLILNEAGTVFSFGNNDFSQCGYDPNQNQNQGPKWRPFKIPDENIPFENKNITSIECGYNHNLLLSQGDVFTFGDNDNGKLGRPVVPSDHNPTSLNLTGVKKIACGANHSMIINQDGSVHGFGDDTYGQTGVNRNINLIRQTVNNAFEDNRGNEAGTQNPDKPLLIKGTGTDGPNNIYGEIVDVACGLNHTMILNKRDEVYSFGNNDLGQLGYNFNLLSFNININANFIQAVDRELQSINNQWVNIQNNNYIINNNILIPREIQQILQQLDKIRQQMQPLQLEKIYQLILLRVQQLQQQSQQLLQQVNQQPQILLQQLAIGRIQILEQSMQRLIQQLPINNFNLTDNNPPLQNQINTKLFDYIINNSPAVRNQRINTFYTNNQGISQPLPITDTLKDYNDNNYKKIKSIACGANHSMIITEAGEVFSFGEHNFGKLGLREENDGNYFNKFSPQRIFDTGYSTYGRIKCASAGENHSLILNKKGNVFSFGYHTNGQLGIVDNDGNQVPNVTIPQKINFNLPIIPLPDEQLNSDYIIRNNTLFKDFEISINNLQKFCEASTYIYIKNIENGEEIFIYNNDDNAQNIFQKQQIGGDVKNSRRLALQIINNKNKLELKINNDSLGKGQFEIKFYNHGFNEIKSVDIKTNEYNETIDRFFDKFFNLILHKVKENINISYMNNKVDDINKEKNRISDIDDYNGGDLDNLLLNLTRQFINNKKTLSNHFFKEKNNLKDLIEFYKDSSIDKNETNKIFIELKKSLNFQINETYFDKSKFNINYLEKYFEIFDNFKSLLISSINEKELLEKSKMNKLLINSFNKQLNCESNIKDFKLDDNFKDFIKNISDLKKLDAVESVDIGDEINDYIKNIDESDYKNYLLSPAYQDFYYYFRYHILEDRIKEYNNNNNEENVFIKGKIEEELKKIYEYYDFNTDIDTHEIKASKLAILGDILDNLLINKIRNVIFNEINSFVKNIKDSGGNNESKFKIKDIISFDVNLININNEFDVDLSKMNDKIKNILVGINPIENKLEYNLGNILIKNVKVQPILYYTNNFFDTNINKQQFILFNKDLKDILKNEIKLDYNLIKSLIENQNINLLRDLKDKILIEYYKIQDLKEYIEQNKINNNKYKYQDFCDNYNYHLEEELKKIQNHKNIFKYYDHLVCTFIYYYENNDKIDMSNSNNNINDDLSDNFDENDELNELFRKIEENNLKIDDYIKEIDNFSDDIIFDKDKNLLYGEKDNEKGRFENDILVFGERIYTDGTIERERKRERGEFSYDKLIIGERIYTDGTIERERERGKFNDDKLIIGERIYTDRTIERGKFDVDKLIIGEKIYTDERIERGEFNTDDKLIIGEKIYTGERIERGEFHENRYLRKGEKIYTDERIEKGEFYENGYLKKGERSFDNITERGLFENNILKIGERINTDGIIEKGEFNTIDNNNLKNGEKIDNNIRKIVGDYNQSLFNYLNNLFNEINNFEYVKDYAKLIITPYSELSEIKQYSKTNIIKRIKKEFEKMITINVERNVINLEKMLIESNDVEDDSNPQLKLEFDTICLSIDLVVGNMYSKLLKRFLLEYLIEKYSSEVDQDDDSEKLKNIDKLKNIIKNIMIKVDELINTKYDGSVFRTTEFTKKLVILHSEGRYKIKNYVDLDEDNLFNEIVNLIKSNPYEKIEEDDIILTYLKDNINDYFKKFYKIAINTLIACSSGINNYILYHNKYKKIVSFLDGIIESKINKFNEDKKNEEDKKENRKDIIEAIKNKEDITKYSEKNKKDITDYSEENKKKIKDFFKTMF